MIKRCLAFDFGASSGRAVICTFDGEKITLDEVHRFSNDPCMLRETFYWDTLRQFYEIKQGIVKAKLAGGFDCIGVNTWGVDFGFLDRDGRLLENSVNYRDARTKGMVEIAESRISKRELYEQTGNQIMEINTAFQLISVMEKRPELLERADNMLLTPDLFNYFLTGEIKAEYSIASTTQLCNPKTRNWNFEVIDKLGLPRKIFPEIVESGTKIGMLSQDICDELGVETCEVYAVCGHDTQDAVVATPAKDRDFIFLSCGTWSLFGTELDCPLVNDITFEMNITNEGGYGGKTTLLNNIIGLWLIQETRRQWQREGKNYSFADMEKMALEAKPFACFIDPDYPDFTPAGNIPQRIKDYCKATGQYVPQSDGEVIRTIYESLAMKYAWTFRQIKNITNKDYSRIHIVGGGVKDGLLCQMTADACNVQVKAGPIEATCLGNCCVALMASGCIESLAEARKIVANSQSVKPYSPSEKANIYVENIERFEAVLRAEI